MDDDGIVNVWWYYREDREFKKIGSNDYVLFCNWYLGSGQMVVLSSSEDMVSSHAPKFGNNI